MEDIKGNLMNVKDSIIKIRIRNRNGHPLHKAEFRLEDRSTLIKELNILKDKFGVDCFDIRGKAINIHKEQQRLLQEEEIKALADWREKTRGLREPISFQEDMRKAL